MGFDGVCYGWVLMGFAMGGFRWFGFAVSLGLGLLPQVVRSVGCFFFFFSFFFFFFFFGGVDGRRGWYSSDFQWW